MRTGSPRIAAVLIAAGLIGAGLAAAAPAVAQTSAPSRAAVDCSWSSADLPLDNAFNRASQSSGVPADVLKAVSYLESRWDDHAGRASADGGYGPMNLTDLTVRSGAKGEGPVRAAASARTARLGATLTGLPLDTIKNDPDANVCAGAAVLASYQGVASADVNDWTGAVLRYGASGSSSQAFVRQVFHHAAHRCEPGHGAGGRGHAGCPAAGRGAGRDEVSEQDRLPGAPGL